jgi:hypothetical protein
MVSLRRLARILAHLEWHSNDRTGRLPETDAAAGAPSEQTGRDPAGKQKPGGVDRLSGVPSDTDTPMRACTNQAQAGDAGPASDGKL